MEVQLIINLQNPAFPDLKKLLFVITFQYRAMHGYGTRNSRTTKLLKTTVQINVIPVSFFWLPCFITCLHLFVIQVNVTFALVNCVRYDEDFAKSRFCFIRFTVILSGLKKIVRYAEDVVIQTFAKPRFHCTTTYWVIQQEQNNRNFINESMRTIYESRKP